MRKITKVLSVMLAVVLAAALAGCGDSLPVLGDKDAGANIAVTNGLGATVTQIRIKEAGSDAWSDGLLSSDQSLDADAEARLYYPESYAGEVDLQVTAEDGTTLEFDDLDLSSYASMTLKSGDGVNYVDYVDADKAEGSTKQAALDVKAAEEEAAKKAAEEEAARKAEEEAAQKAAEEEAARKAEEEAAAQKAAEEAAAAAAASSSNSNSGSGSSYSGGSTSSSSSDSGSSAAAAPAQSEDRCLDDPIFND